MKEQYTYYKGVYYYTTYRQAAETCKFLEGMTYRFFGKTIKATPRVVEFKRGWAVQYCKSGGYYPEEAPHPLLKPLHLV